MITQDPEDPGPYEDPGTQQNPHPYEDPEPQEVSGPYEDARSYEDPGPYKDSELFGDPGKTQELRNQPKILDFHIMRLIWQNLQLTTDLFIILKAENLTFSVKLKICQK